MADEQQFMGVMIECAVPLFTLCARFDREADGKSADELKARCEALLIDFENACRQADVALSHIDAAKYAIVALIDECVLMSELPLQDEWLNEPLQMRLYGDFAAGEEFYRRLDELLRDSEARPALEIYHACLSLGFKGKHADRRGAERRRVLLDQITKGVLRGREDDTALAARTHVDADPAAHPGPGLLARMPTWSIPVGVGLVVILTAIVCSLVLDAAIADFESTLAAN
ncbi:MAG: DotU family type IV/VI secretion system protein [Planctomycetota bacterium]